MLWKYPGAQRACLSLSTVAIAAVLTAAAQLIDDEFLVLMKAIKSRWDSVHEPGDNDGGGDGGQPRAE